MQSDISDSQGRDVDAPAVTPDQQWERPEITGFIWPTKRAIFSYEKLRMDVFQRAKNRFQNIKVKTFTRTENSINKFLVCN